MYKFGLTADDRQSCVEALTELRHEYKREQDNRIFSELKMIVMLEAANKQVCQYIESLQEPISIHEFYQGIFTAATLSSLQFTDLNDQEKNAVYNRIIGESFYSAIEIGVITEPDPESLPPPLQEDIDAESIMRDVWKKQFGEQAWTVRKNIIDQAANDFMKKLREDGQEAECLPLLAKYMIGKMLDHHLNPEHAEIAELSKAPMFLMEAELAYSEYERKFVVPLIRSITEKIIPDAIVDVMPSLKNEATLANVRDAGLRRRIINEPPESRLN